MLFEGNCLFASLSDQLYGTSTRHPEIRSAIIEHMRAYQPLYEEFVQVSDIIQRRATRATTESMRKGAEANPFEEYLAAMSRPGCYGGQAELLAFVRAYDQDVMVHLPPSSSWDLTTMSYSNDYRDPEAEVKPSLHICYGGDEEKNAHYDSSRKSNEQTHNHALTTRPKFQSQSNDQLSPTTPKDSLNSRALRNLKSDPSKDMMHELVTQSNKDLRSSLEMLNDQRARSPSVTSSYSTGSKRSYEDDGEQPRASKRATKRRSLRSQAALSHLSVPYNTSQPMSSGPPTPTSSQDTDSSFEQAESAADAPVVSSASSPQVITISSSDDSDTQHTAIRAQRIKASLRKKASANLQTDTPHNIPSIVMEQSRSALRV